MRARAPRAVLDGATQVPTADEFCYHEMLSHVPILAHGRARDVLIIGGGDCGLAKEVLKHDSVSAVTQVEVDEAVISVSRRHLSRINAPVFRDPRFRLVIADGLKFVQTTTRRFDMILVDSTDPAGPSMPLFTQTFYRSVRDRLRPEGVLVTQSGVPFLQSMAFSATMSTLRTIFPLVTYLTVALLNSNGSNSLIQLQRSCGVIEPYSAAPT